MDNKRALYFFVILACLGIGTFLGEVFSGALPVNQTFSIAGFSLRYYGLVLAVAAVCGWLIARKRSAQFKVGLEQTDNIFIYVFIAGFLGARIYHVFSEWDYYLSHISEIIKVWNGGLAIYGAIVGGLLGLYIAKRQLKLTQSFSQLLDWLVPSLVLGQAVGRFGNFFNYELFGYPTTLPWGMFVPAKFRPTEFLDAQFFHPLFLYESLACCLIFIILLKISRREWKAGTLFITYILLYNIVRFFIELLRIETTIWAGIRVNLVISLILIVVSLALLLHRHKRAKA